MENYDQILGKRKITLETNSSGERKLMPIGMFSGNYLKTLAIRKWTLGLTAW